MNDYREPNLLALAKSRQEQTREHVYRQGYWHGVEEAQRLMSIGACKEMIHEFLWGALYYWRVEGGSRGAKIVLPPQLWPAKPSTNTYMICVEGGSSPKKLHETLASAEAEQDRLSKMNHGKNVDIVQVVKRVKTSLVTQVVEV